MARNCFFALDLESDSEPEFDPEPLSRSHFGGEPTVPSHFGVFGLEQQTLEPENLEVSISTEPKTQTPETESSADYLSAKDRTETAKQFLKKLNQKQKQRTNDY